MTMRRVLVLAPAALVLSLASPSLGQAAPSPWSPPSGEEPNTQAAETVTPPQGGSAPVSEEPAPPTEPLAPAPVPVPVYPPPPPPARAEAHPRTPLVAAETEAEARELDDGQLGSHQAHFTLQLGARTSFISEPGFDLFSEDDVFVQVGVAGGRVLLAEGPLSIAALVGWDYGVKGSTARGAATELEQHRLWLGGEARYHVLRRLYAFVRLAPALLATELSLRDPIAQSDREAGGFLFGADASAGAAFELFGKASGRSTNPRGWVTADGGYGWAQSEELSFSASEDDSAPTRTASLDLGELALRGGFFRVGVAVTF